MMHPDYRVEGEWFVRKRLGTHERAWGVYHRIGGQDIMYTAFMTRGAAERFVNTMQK